MDDDVIKVDKYNCEKVAQKILDCLVGTIFGVASFYHTGMERPEHPRVLTHMVLFGGYVFRDGCLTIKFVPNRRLFWDLNEEKVTVRFSDEDDSIIVERLLPSGKIIYRVIMVLC